MRESVFVIGYTMDAVMEAVSLATDGKEVTLVATGKPGESADAYGDLLSEGYSVMLDTLLPGRLQYTRYMNPRFIYMPYSKVKVANRTNGVIQYPLSRKSFCDDSEWKECCEAFAKKEIQDVLADKTLSPSKLVTAMKNNMPQKFVDTFCKAMQVTRWRGMQLSGFSMLAFNFEFRLDHLSDESYNEFYVRPSLSYAEICDELCRTYGVNVEITPVNKVKGYIVSRKIPGDVIIMDNRVDQYLDYIGGRFDRSKVWSTLEPVPPELKHSPDGFYLTPLNECWGTGIFDGKARKFMSSPMNTLYDTEVSEIPATKNNVKLYNQYSELVRHYGNKKLDLGSRIEFMIRG